MQDKTNTTTTPEKGKHKRLGVILGSIVFVMFGFAFAMVPLYQLICSVTGINSIATNSGRVSAEQYVSEKINEQRTVLVEFDVTLNEQIPFTPLWQAS